MGKFILKVNKIFDFRPFNTRILRTFILLIIIILEVLIFYQDYSLFLYKKFNKHYNSNSIVTPLLFIELILKIHENIAMNILIKTLFKLKAYEDFP